MPYSTGTVESVIVTVPIVATIDREIEVEAFREGLLVAGSGYTNEYSQSDLDQILETLNPSDPAPVVLGHPKMDSPAYGWISKGRKYLRDGKWRIAFGVGDMTAQFAEWLENKHFRKVSIGLYHPNDKHNPTPGKWKLRHLGFLGGTPPAVSGLQMVEYSEDDTYLAIEYGSTEDKAAISSGFRSLSGVLRSFREWVISEKDLEAADRLIPSYLIDDLDWTAGRLMQSAQDSAESEMKMGMGYATYSESLAIALEGKDLDQIATAANMPARDIRLFASGIASPSAKQISILSDALGAELTPDPKLPSDNVTPDYAMPTDNSDTRNTEGQNSAPANSAADSSVNFAAENARLSAENATLQAKNDALEARFSALEERLNQQQANAEKAEAVAFAQQLVSDRKILPAKKAEIAERIMAFDNTAQITFSADAPAKTQRQIYMDTLAAGQPLYSDDQILSDDQTLETEFAVVRQAQQQGFDKSSLSDDLKIQAYMKERGGYTVADMRSADSTRRDAACALYAEAMSALNIDYTG